MEPGVIDVWRIDLDRPAETLPSLHDILSPDERARAGRFRHTIDRNRFVAARGSLRHLLARYRGSVPEDVAFAYGANGKPHLEDERNGGAPAPLYFNLAHSGCFCLIAVSGDSRVGIDVERVRPLPDLERVARHLFTIRERIWFSRLPPLQRLTGFSHVWVRKEALLKATGEGLSRSPSTVEVSLPPERPVQILSVQGEPDARGRWFLTPLEPAPGYVGALVTERTPETFIPRIRVRS